VVTTYLDANNYVVLRIQDASLSALDYDVDAIVHDLRRIAGSYEFAGTITTQQFWITAHRHVLPPPESIRRRK